MKERQKVDNSIRQKVKDKNYSQVGSSTSHTIATNLHKRKHSKTFQNTFKPHKTTSEREREREREREWSWSLEQLSKQGGVSA